MRIKKRYQGKVPVSCQSHCACIVESASCEFIYILTIIFAKSQDFFHELILFGAGLEPRRGDECAWVGCK